MSTEVIEVQAEEVGLISTINEKLVKANVTDAVIAALHGRFGSLRLKDLDDKEGYLEIKAAAKDCAKIRNLAKKVCTEGREDAVKIQKLWVAKEKEVIKRVAEIEDVLDGEIERFDKEVDRKKEEEKQRVENAYMARTQELTKMGAVYVDSEFSLGNFSIEANLVKECSQSVWEAEMYPKFREQYEIIEAERIAAEKLREEQEAEMKRKQAEFEQKQREFEEQQAAFKKQQEEAERIANAEKLRLENEAKQKEAVEIQRRCNQLSAMGMTFSGQHSAFIYEDVNVDNNTEISLLNGEEWEALVIKIAPIIEQRKQEAEQKRLAEMEKQKQAAAEFAAQKERERIAEEQTQSEIKRKQEEQRKAEELALSDDKTKYASVVTYLKAVPIHEMKSNIYKGKMNAIQQLINSL